MNNYNNDGLFNQRMLDALTFIGFMIGIANYSENLGQSDVQDMIKGALNDIHEHLAEQDRKIDYLIELLEGGEQNGEVNASKGKEGNERTND